MKVCFSKAYVMNLMVLILLQFPFFFYCYKHLASVPGLPRSVRVLIMRRRKTFEKRGRPGLKYHVR